MHRKVWKLYSEYCGNVELKKMRLFILIIGRKLVVGTYNCYIKLNNNKNLKTTRGIITDTLS